MKLQRLAFVIALLSCLVLANTRQHATSIGAAAPLQIAATKKTAIVGATLIDGSGSRPVPNAVVLFKGDSIIAAGSSRVVKVPADATVIDGKGLVVAPGFIDTHNHSDRGLSREPEAASQVSQGITTIAVGQDGGSECPIGPYLKNLDERPVALNVLTFVGHATVRSLAMGE